MHERRALRKSQAVYKLDGVDVSGLELLEYIRAKARLSSQGSKVPLFELDDLINTSYLYCIEKHQSLGCICASEVDKIILQATFKRYRPDWRNFSCRNYTAEQLYEILNDKVIEPEARKYELIELLRDVLTPIIPRLEIEQALELNDNL